MIVVSELALRKPHNDTSIVPNIQNYRVYPRNECALSFRRKSCGEILVAMTKGRHTCMAAPSKCIQREALRRGRLQNRLTTLLPKLN